MGSSAVTGVVSAGVAVGSAGGSPDVPAASGALGPGAYSYKAAIAGDSNYLGDDSDCENFTVNQAQPTLTTAPPAEFDGPGDRWSPETLLCAAVADCFLLSFRAIARAAKFDWHGLECRVEGTLDRVDGRTRFTAIVVQARLQVPAGTAEHRAQRLVEKAEHVCLISNSLVATRRVETTIVAG